MNSATAVGQHYLILCSTLYTFISAIRILPTIPQTFPHFWIPHFTFHIPHSAIVHFTNILSGDIYHLGQG